MVIVPAVGVSLASDRCLQEPVVHGALGRGCAVSAQTFLLEGTTFWKTRFSRWVVGHYFLYEGRVLPGSYLP